MLQIFPNTVNKSDGRESWNCGQVDSYNNVRHETSITSWSREMEYLKTKSMTLKHITEILEAYTKA